MVNTAITTRGLDVISEETVAPSQGQQRTPKAQSPAQRSKSYRDRLDERGLKPVKCYLAPDQVAYLDALCKIHKVTISEAIGMALTALFRGVPSLP